MQESPALSTEARCESEAAKRPPSRKRRRPKAWRRAVVALAILACVICLHRVLLEGIAELLIVDERPAHCQHLCIRTADSVHHEGDRCYDRAAEWYQEETSRSILVIAPYPSRLVEAGVLPSFEVAVRRELNRRRVPGEAITVIDGGAETAWEDARLLDLWMRDHPAAQVLIPCDRFGSRRWRHILDAVLPPDRAARAGVMALPDRRYDETNWWKSRRGVKSLFYAYVGLVYAWVGGETVPPDRWNPDEYERTLAGIVREGP